jgi:hypothetical protein
MHRSVERAAANELAFRRANEQIDRAREELHVDAERTPYICECEAERCTEILVLTLAEYQEARSSPRRFFVRDGHQSPQDAIVAERDGFIVIEKTGREGELVEQAGVRG